MDENGRFELVEYAVLIDMEKKKTYWYNEEKSQYFILSMDEYNSARYAGTKKIKSASYVTFCSEYSMLHIFVQY